MMFSEQRPLSIEQADQPNDGTARYQRRLPIHSPSFAERDRIEPPATRISVTNHLLSVIASGRRARKFPAFLHTGPSVVQAKELPG
jgi:hypothetical protein